MSRSAFGRDGAPSRTARPAGTIYTVGSSRQGGSHVPRGPEPAVGRRSSIHAEARAHLPAPVPCCFPHSPPLPCRLRHPRSRAYIRPGSGHSCTSTVASALSSVRPRTPSSGHERACSTAPRRHDLGTRGCSTVAADPGPASRVQWSTMRVEARAPLWYDC